MVNKICVIHMRMLSGARSAISKWVRRPNKEQSLSQELLREQPESEREQDGRVWENLNISCMKEQLQIIPSETLKDPQQRAKQVQAFMQSLKYLRLSIQNQVAILIIFLEQNRAFVDGHLSRIDLDAQTLKSDLEQVLQNLDRYVQKLAHSETSIRQLHSRAKVMTVLVQLLGSYQIKDNTPLRTISFVIEAQLKLRMSLIFFNSFTNEDNVLNCSPSEFREVWERVITIPCQNLPHIKEDYQKSTKTLCLLAGAVMQARRWPSFLKRFALGFKLISGLWWPEHNRLHSMSFYRAPTLQLAQECYEVFEDGFLMHLTNLSFPKIATNVMLYIPLEYEQGQPLDIFAYNSNAIPVRLLYHRPLPARGSKQKTEPFTDAIVHMHGGGFVTLSSRTAQNYTRRWANQLHIPVFSIDYRKAPEHPFPQAHLDCLTVYKFITQHLNKHLPYFDLRNMYIGGDSAGASLTCALTTLILEQKLLAPQGLYLAYPGADLRSTYYPSRKSILNDIMIWPTVAGVMMEGYLGKDTNNSSSHYASPLLLTQSHITSDEPNNKAFPSSWPLTYFLVGTQDTVRDEILLLMQRMVEAGVECQCFMFEDLKHAFLNTEGMVRQSTRAIEISIDIFRDLMEQRKNK